MPRSLRWATRARISLTAIGSMPASGSSSRMKLGWVASARAEQADYLAALHRDADVAQHRTALKALAEPIADQAMIVGDQPRRRLAEPSRSGVGRCAASHAPAAH